MKFSYRLHSQVRLSKAVLVFLLIAPVRFWAANPAPAQPPATAPGTVGAAGEPDLLEFQGNVAIPASAIRGALSQTPSYLLMSHPQAPLKDLLEQLVTRLTAGYRSQGFRTPKILVNYDDESHRIRISITEGPRYTAAGISINGVSPDLAAEIEKALTRPRVAEQTWFIPNAVLETNSLETLIREQATLITKNESQPQARSITPAAWQLEHPARLDDNLPQQAEQVVRQVLGGRGFMFPRVEVRTRFEDTNLKAILQVTVRDPGPPGRIAEILVTNNVLNSRDQILQYLELKPGTVISKSLLERVDSKLAESGRFIHWSLVSIPIRTDASTQSGATANTGSSPGVRMELSVREEQHAPKLTEPLSPEQQALVRLGVRLSSFAAGSQELHAIVKIGTNSPMAPGTEGELLISPKEGLLLRVSRLSGKPASAALLLASGCLGIYGLEPVQKFEFASEELSTYANLLMEGLPAGQTNRWNFTASGGFRNRHDKLAAAAGEPPFKLQMAVPPALLMSEVNGATLKGGRLELERENFTMLTDESGNLERLLVSGPSGFLDVRTCSNRFSQAQRELQKSGPDSGNAPAPAHTFSSLLNFCLESIVANHLQGRPTQAGLRARAVRKLFGDELFAVLDEYSAPTQETSFTIPPDAHDVALAKNNVFSMFAGPVFTYGNKLFPRYSWPWTLTREFVLVMAGDAPYAEPELQRLYNSEEVGPIGSLVTAKLLAFRNPAAAKTFALRGLVHLSEGDFERDCALLLEGEAGLARSFAVFVGNLRKLSADELQSLAEVLPQSESRLLTDLGSALRSAAPNASLAITLTPALNTYWNECLRAKIRAELQKIAYRPVDK